MMRGFLLADGHRMEFGGLISTSNLLNVGGGVTACGDLAAVADHDGVSSDSRGRGGGGADSDGGSSADVLCHLVTVQTSSSLLWTVELGSKPFI